MCLVITSLEYVSDLSHQARQIEFGTDAEPIALVHETHLAPRQDHGGDGANQICTNLRLNVTPQYLQSNGLPSESSNVSMSALSSKMSQVCAYE